MQFTVELEGRGTCTKCGDIDLSLGHSISRGSYAANGLAFIFPH